jgi:hypothetical protein
MNPQQPQQQQQGNGQVGRPDEGVTKDRNTLTMEGFANGAGASYR